MKALSALLVALVLALVFVAPSVRASGTTVDNPMRLDGTNLCLTPGVPTQVGAPVLVTTCSGSPTQLWWHNGNQLQWSLGGVNLCVDGGPSQWTGATVFLNVCDGSSVQQWAADPVTTGSTIRIWMVGQQWCLEPRSDDLVAVYPCALVASQHWVGP